MPNGKGTLDGSYCIYFNKTDGYPTDFGKQKECRYHKTKLPKPKNEHNNRICCHFEPNKAYEKHNSFIWTTLARRFAWFGIDMNPGTLYEFPYNEPSDI